MTRLEKIYRDKPDVEEMARIIRGEPCHTIESCDFKCFKCVQRWLNEEVPEYDAEFIAKLKAVKLLYPWARYLAMDKPGKAYMYENCPIKHAKEPKWAISEGDVGYLFVLNDYSTDWGNSLIDIDKVIKEAEKNGTIC